MEIVFILIPSLLFGVLGLVLFFKIWEQTNNVKVIKEKLAASMNIREEFEYWAIAGDYDKAEEAVMKWLAYRHCANDNDPETDLEFAGSLLRTIDRSLPDNLSSAERFNDFRYSLRRDVPDTPPSYKSMNRPAAWEIVSIFLLAGGIAAMVALLMAHPL